MGCEPQGLARGGLRNAVDLEENAAGADRKHIMIDASLSAAHSHFGRALRNGLVGKNPDPEASGSFQGPGDRLYRGLK